MNKAQFLGTLDIELHRAGVADADEVLADYDAHFVRKSLDGYSEAEIARGLGSPQEIASDYRKAEHGETALRDGSGHRLGIRIALCFVDLLAVLLLALLFTTSLSIAACGLATLAVGFYMAFGLTLPVSLPYMPPEGRLLLGLTILGLATLLLAGAVWFTLFTKQGTRSFGRWHANLWFGRHEVPLPAMPQLRGKPRRILRRIVLFSLILTMLFFSAAYITMAIQAGSLGFWHVWHWFL